MKKAIAIVLAVWMMLSLFGCGQNQSTSDELWIVTEATTWDRMNGQIAAVAAQFEKEHEGITVRIDILPTEAQERSVYIQQLRTQILRGGGPDVYLLPTSEKLVMDDTVGRIFMSVDPLFSDVVQAMDNGVFRDISAQYDADTALNKEALRTTVMDAGVRDGKRYVLPLRYDIPVIYADVEEMALFGIRPEDLEQSADKVIDQVLALKDPILAGAFSDLGTNAFSKWIDYDGQKVDLNVSTLATFLRNYQTLHAQRASYGEKMNVQHYCHKVFEREGGLIRYRLYVGSLSDLVEYAPVYQYEERKLAVVPMRGIGGQVVAEVTYYGAVGSGCQDPELAYEFLRQFLMEDSQWEANRPQSINAVGEKGRKINTTNTSQYPGLIERGWPVLSEGSLDSLWIVRKRQFYNHKLGYADPDVAKRMKKIGRSQLDSSWEQILLAEPDLVRFGNSLDGAFQATLQQLNDPVTNEPINVDINALAEKFWWQLRWHVAEG